MKRYIEISVIAMVFFSFFLIIGPQRIRAEGDVATSPTLSVGTKFDWSYHLQNPEGDATKNGTMSSTVYEVSWRGFDCFKFEGTFHGSYSTTSGSGTENGSWYQIYRKIDLAYLDGGTESELSISTNTVKNTTHDSYSPELRWIEFPLSYTKPRSIWDTPEVSHITTWVRIINDDDQTLESGSDSESIDLHWICINEGSLISKKTGAGTFQTYVIKEGIQNDEPRNQKTEYYYSDDIGWWVVKDVFVDHEGEQVRIKHYELTDWSVNHPPVIEFQPNVEMDEDIPDDSIDLDEVFSDPEGDPLAYEIINSGPLIVEIQTDGTLSITPPSNDHGSWNLSLTASDGKHRPVELTIPITILPVDDPPQLFDPNFNPSSGDSDQIFTFTIRLTDIDSGSPISAKVYFDSDSHGLSYNNGDNSSGMGLKWSGRLEPGVYTHFFIVDNTRYPVTGSISGPEVRSSGLPYLENGGVGPDEGGLGTEFRFQVTWKEPNSEEPDDVYLYLDGVRSSLEEYGGDPLSGLTFDTYMSIDEGDHYYHFEASLGDLNLRYPLSGEIDGPLVHSPEILECGYIHLENSAMESDYRFFVNYRYLAGLAPLEVTVLLNGREYTITELQGTPPSGMNYTKEISILEGNYGIQYRILADGILLSKDSTDLIVEIDDGEGQDDQGGGGSNDTGNNTAILIVLILSIIAAGSVGFILYSKKKRRREMEMEDQEIEEDEQWDR